jgi:DNA-binding CsgD family transcriptional regulator
LNDIPVKEQAANIVIDFFTKLFYNVGIYDAMLTVQVQPGANIDDGERVLEEVLSQLTGNGEWLSLVDVSELYNDLAPREKELLLILSEYSIEEVAKITGLEKESLYSLRRSIYGKIDPDGKRRHHTIIDLRDFCKALERAGVKLIVWNESMEKERRKRN